MNKKEKKAELTSLARKIYESKSIDEIEKLSEQLLTRIYSCGFSVKQLSTISNTVDSIIVKTIIEIAENINNDENKELDKNVRDMFIAISSLVDLSFLPD